MQCLGVNASFQLEVLSPQPSDLSSCQMVVGSYSEINSDVMQLTPEQGALVAGAILTLWAIAWVFRMLARTLNVGDMES